MGPIDAVGGRHAEGLFGGFAGSRDWRRGGRPVGARGGASVGGRGIDGDRLGWSVVADRAFRSQITEGPQPLATGGADELAIGANHSASRSHAGGDPRALGRVRGSVVVSSIWRFTTDTASAFKKTVHAAEQQCPDGPSTRHHWKTALQQKLDPKKLVFIDETGTATNMARGRC